MSNTVTIKRTKFEDMIGGDVSYGYRIYDNYSPTICHVDMFPSEKDVPESDLDLLKLINRDSQSNEDIDEILNYCHENRSGLEIDGTWYDWSEIQAILEEV